MNPLKKLASQTAIYGLPTIVGRLMTFFLSFFYTYICDTGEFGVLTSLYAYVSLFLVILTYGMETALLRFSQTELDKDKVYSTSLISVFSTSVIFIFIVVLYSSPIAHLIKLKNHSEYILWFAIILATDATSAISFVKLRQQNNAKRFAIIKSINIVVFILLNAFFFKFCPNIHKNPNSIFYPFVERIYSPEIGIAYSFIANLITSVLTFILLIPEMFKVTLMFNFYLWKKMMHYAFPLLIAGTAGMVNETMDRILLTYLLPEDIAMSQTGIYGACYRLSIIMSVFIQAFRFAAEPFFFSNAKEKDAKQHSADIMKYFTLICSIIFLGTMMNISWIQSFIDKPYRIGISVVPILLIANLCLGVFINQSIWYKLSGQTRYGAYLAIFGALITLFLNFYWIPIYGYMGSAWATLICYASMMIVSYFIGNKHYPVNYDLKRILGYVGLSLTLYGLSCFINIQSQTMSLIINNILLIGFIALIWKLEKKNLFPQR